MDMTRDFINKIEELSEPHQIEHNGRLYTDKHMTALPCGSVANSPLDTESLSSVVDYLSNSTDGGVLKGRPIIHVAGPDTVNLFMEMSEDKVRDNPLRASANVNSFPFGRFMNLENFIINLQSSFVQDENTAALLNFVATVKQDTGVEQQDDGITQRVTARSGISLAKSASAPNPVTLRPFRTFSEIEQPASRFVFRLQVSKAAESKVEAALFEADGSAWKHEAIVTIKDYFEKELPKEIKAIILA